MDSTKALRNTKKRVDSILREAKVLQRKYEDFDAEACLEFMMSQGIDSPEKAWEKMSGSKNERPSNPGELQKIIGQVVLKPVEAETEELASMTSSHLKPRTTNPAGQTIYPEKKEEK